MIKLWCEEIKIPEVAGVNEFLGRRLIGNHHHSALGGEAPVVVDLHPSYTNSCL